MKRGLLQFIQHLAASVFVGITVYGIILYYGGEVQKRIPMGRSLLLGLGAVVCIVIVVATGGIQDKLALKDLEREEEKRKH